MSNVETNSGTHCSGCGLCESICPVNAIEIVETKGFLRPSISEKCIGCGKCVKYCPGINQRERVRYADFKYKFYGHSKNREVRNEAASGGVTSELIRYLLANKYVDYVITGNCYCCDRNASYALIESDKFDSVYMYSGSNYCPTNLGKAISEISKRNGVCAIVCLPCLARGIQKLREDDETLNYKIKYVITLLCNHVPSYEATDYLLAKYHIKSPTYVKYRGNGWFGNFRAYNKDCTEIMSIPFSEYFVSKFSVLFWQEACVGCMDHFGSAADICMGDADFIKYRTPQISNEGETICFINNEEFVEILQNMKSQEIISLFDDIKPEELKLIYGPLEHINRADRSNLRTGYAAILAEEKRVEIKNRAKRVVFLLNNIIIFLRRKMKRGK